MGGRFYTIHPLIRGVKCQGKVPVTKYPRLMMLGEAVYMVCERYANGK